MVILIASLQIRTNLMDSKTKNSKLITALYLH